MARGTLIIVLLWLSVSGQAYGQASDIELKAAYCLGYERSFRIAVAQVHEKAAELNTGLLNNLNATDPKVRADAQAMLPSSDTLLQHLSEKMSDLDQKIERLKDYIMSKGFSSTGGKSRPFLVANTRGERDYQDCVTQSKAPSGACLSRCKLDCNSGSEQCESCMVNSCSVPESCRRGYSCKDLYPKLPF